MTVISLEHTKPQIRGYLSRYMTEMRPGVFAGVVKKKTRDILVHDIITYDPDVDMVIVYQYKGRMTMESYGCPTRSIADFEGCQLLSRTITKEHGNGFW